jgi:hypothetical protein
MGVHGRLGSVAEMSAVLVVLREVHGGKVGAARVCRDLVVRWPAAARACGANVFRWVEASPLCSESSPTQA